MWFWKVMRQPENTGERDNVFINKDTGFNLKNKPHVSQEFEFEWVMNVLLQNMYCFLIDKHRSGNKYTTSSKVREKQKCDYFGKVWTLALHLAAPCPWPSAVSAGMGFLSPCLWWLLTKELTFWAEVFFIVSLLHVFLQNLRVRRVDRWPAIQIKVEPVNSGIRYIIF